MPPKSPAAPTSRTVSNDGSLQKLRALHFHKLTKVPGVGVVNFLTTEPTPDVGMGGNGATVESIALRDDLVLIINGTFKIPVAGGAVLGWY